MSTDALMQNSGAQALPLWPGLIGEDAEGPFLTGCRCSRCGFLALGMRPQCSQCWSTDTLSPTPIGRRGLLYTCTVVHAAPVGYEAPYAVGYVDLDENVRVFAHIESDDAMPAIGETVELTVAQLRTDSDGRARTGPRYRRAAKQETA